MREIIIQWLEEASKLEYGSKLHLVASNKREQTLLYNAIEKELEILKKIDPSAGATLLPFTVFRSGRFWVGIEKILAIPTVGFIKDAMGQMKKVRLPKLDSDRPRRIKLMCEDGLSLEAIEELEGPLSKQETEEIKSLKEG